MSQSIFIQVGQCGNQIGWRFWDLALQEHSQYNSKGIYDESMSSFFRNVDRKTGENISVGDETKKISDLRARGILIDMEEGVINQVKSSPQSFLFDDRQIISNNSGSGNNWAVGYSEYGLAFHDSMLEAIRYQAEFCDSLQSFILCHSVGGGTGSGLGSYLCTALQDNFPDVYRFSASIFPNQVEDDVITSPYNSLLSLNSLGESADCVFPVDNNALIDICQRISQLVENNSIKYKGSTLIKKEDPLSLKSREPSIKYTIADSYSKTNVNRQKSILTGIKSRPFDYMNNIVSQMLLNLTSSARFKGSLNVDINEICMNLVPFPNLKYLISSMSPLYTLSSMDQSPRNLDQMFSDSFSRENTLSKADLRNNLFLACALMVRGNVEISDIRRNIERIKSQLNFVYWNQEGWKTGICSMASLGQQYSLLTLSNNCSIKNTFQDMKTNFVKLYKRKANVHHYTKYIDKEYFDNALNNVNSLIEDYNSIEKIVPPTDQELNQWRHSILY